MEITFILGVKLCLSKQKVPHASGTTKAGIRHPASWSWSDWPGVWLSSAWTKILKKYSLQTTGLMLDKTVVNKKKHEGDAFSVQTLLGVLNCIYLKWAMNINHQIEYMLIFYTNMWFRFVLQIVQSQ